MDLPQPLFTGTLVRRYKRFLADVVLDDGRELTVHCANSGAMTGMNAPGMRVLVSDSGNPRRKLRHTLERVHVGSSWVGVNTARPNHVVAEAVEQGLVEPLTGYATLRREVRCDGASRLDLLLEDPDRPRCWVEVKSATLAEGDVACFPDAVTTRGLRHIEALQALVAAGDRACLFFLVGRTDCTAFRPADEVDPAYGTALREAVANGVEVMAYDVRHDADATVLRSPLAVVLDPPG